MWIRQEHRQMIEERFNKVELAKERKDRLSKILKNCTEDENICMKYLYAYMPDQDLTTYSETMFFKFVQQALKVRALTTWGEEVDSTNFLNYILQYRINNENIEFYKDEFFNEIFPRIKDLSMYEAAVEVNYWCFEKATYQATDVRTASPLTVLKNIYGRCGEESTLTVAALRSVGIPARQVYVPRWAHCDDNHAWVEVWIDGGWHFLGACEPEARLDTGWFRLPASKGMLIHHKIFSTLVEDENIMTQSDATTEINRLAHYAQAKEVTVKVKDSRGNKLEGAKVRFELINHSELFPIAELTTNNQGEVKLLTGLGDLIIHIHKEGQFIWQQLDTRLLDKIEIILGDEIVDKDTKYIRLVPPIGGILEEEPLTKEQKSTHEIKNEKALRNREAFKSSFYTGEKAKEWAEKYKPYEVEVSKNLEGSLGNYQEIMDFITDQETQESLGYKIELLSTLSKKDLTDITCLILKEHLIEALKYEGSYDWDLFKQYILCPRVDFEMIRSYRKEVLNYFSPDILYIFRENPKKVYEFVINEIRTSGESSYSTLYTSVAGMLEARKGSLISKKVLFVAICRTLGIPARLNKEDHTVSYYEKDRWITLGVDGIEVSKRSTIILKKEKMDLEFSYFKNFTVGKLEKGVYTTLNLEDTPWEKGFMTCAVEAGHYRVITSNRLANEAILARLYYIHVAENEKVELIIGVTEEETQVEDIEIPNQSLKTLEAKYDNLSNLIGEKHNIVAYLDVAAEPTEHLLNEIIQSKDQYNLLQPKIIFIINKVEDMQNTSLQKALLAVPHIRIYTGTDKTYLGSIYEAFNIEDKRLPLVYIMNKPMKAQYAWAGYNVGIGEMLLKYI